MRELFALLNHEGRTRNIPAIIPAKNGASRMTAREPEKLQRIKETVTIPGFCRERMMNATEINNESKRKICISALREYYPLTAIGH